MNKKVLSVIDIGSSAIRMSIVEVIDGKISILEELRQQVRLGKDTFNKGKILRPTINQCILILKNYKNLCDEYKVEEIYVVATTAVREASNVDIFIDNIFSNTGLAVEIISTTKETEYIYNAINSNIINKFKRNDEYQAIIEIGSGTVEISIFNRKSIIFSRSLPMGALKMKMIFSDAPNAEESFLYYLKATVERELRNLKREIPASKVSAIYGIGSELELLTKILNSNENENYINKKELEEFCSKIHSFSDDEIVHKMNVPYDYADTFHPIIFMFSKVIDFFECDKIYIPKVNLRYGVAQSVIDSIDKIDFFCKYQIQFKTTAINIGRRLNFDENHALKVMNLALKIFDETSNAHQLGDKEKAYLMISSILHDIGASLSDSSHHKHSMYIIKSQDFFYLEERQKNIIANVARYHRSSDPKSTHPDYMELSPKDRMIVMKLSSILRIADSLDNTHLQLVKNIRVIKDKPNSLIIAAYVKDQIFAELYSFRYKKILFETLFGVSLRLKIKKD